VSFWAGGVPAPLSRDRQQTLWPALCHAYEQRACHYRNRVLRKVVVYDIEEYQAVLVNKLLEWPIIREVRSIIAIQCLKVAAPLPLQHLTSRS
jgi:hypothetical protein